MALNPNPLRSPLDGATRRAAAVPLCAALLLLSACGGGGEQASSEPAATEPGVDIVAGNGTEGRRFMLWQPGQEAIVRAAQAALADAAGSDEVRLVVRLNPAAVPPANRATMLGGSSGEGGDAAAQHARQLAVKAAAVATAVDEVMVRSVRTASPRAALKQRFAHALEGFVLTVPFDQAQAVADQLARDPGVDGVELDRALAVEQSAPVRSLDSRAWGVDRLDQRARVLDGAFRHSSTGLGVTVHVVDTGVSPHGQFGTRLRNGFSAIADGQGTRDCHGHGTHVAGTATGSTLGVAPGASVVPVRVLDCLGSGTGTQLLAGLDWIAANGSRPGVVNMSLGGPAFAALDAAAQRLVSAGFTVVAAAGNSNVDACTQSPGRAAGLVTVAASDTADAKASFSNSGTCVALWAPGTNIASAGIASGTAVVGMSGTSMAAPHAAGVAALLLQAQPLATAAQVRARLLQDATPNAVLGLTDATPRGLLYAGDTTLPLPPPSVAIRPAAITVATTVPTPGLWAANATVQVVNAQGTAVTGARVAGRFSHSTAEASCTTVADGRCTLASPPAAWGATPQITVALTGLSGPQMADAGTGVRSAQVAQPAAPVASVSALSGSMVRPAPNSPQWTPQFDVTLADAQRAPVTGAVVQGLLRVHSGARVVGLQSVACQTAANGQCRVVWTGPTLGSTHTGAVLEVQAVSRAWLTYTPGPIKQATVGVVR
ncbi:MAG: S8 family peptidase [Betaproteobacteria bacterium]